MKMRNTGNGKISAVRGMALALLILGATVVLGSPPTFGRPLDQGKTQGAQSKPAQPMAPAGTAFTYQGKLKDGANPANGQYDFQFRLYDDHVAGNQVGSTLSVANQTVTDGLFTVELDFGVGAMQGDARWLEIDVRQAGGGTYTTLSPRQPLNATPYAQSLVPGAVVQGSVPGYNAVLKTSNSTEGFGLWGESTGAGGIGVLGSASNATSTGVYGTSPDTGVTGFAAQRGVYGLATGQNGIGVHGVSNNGFYAIGVSGESTNGTGVQGTSPNSWGVSGSTYGIGLAGVHGDGGGNSCGVEGTSSGAYAGVYGQSYGNNGTGVIGVANSGSGAAGVQGQSTAGIGVRGSSTSGYGVRGESTDGRGVYGSSTTFLGVGGYSTNSYGVSGGTGGIGQAGVYGSGGANSYGVEGYGLGTYAGVYGHSDAGNGTGVIGVANNGYGVRGSSPPATGWAGWFDGNVNVTGTCCLASMGTFRIDHPTDPANKYLYQAAVESPDLTTVYNGNVVLDARGEAAVSLPPYADALNKDFRYQLTAIGAPGPDLYVAQEIQGNSFKIAGGKAGMKVSWQVTGVRNDPYAVAHPVQVEVDKPANEKGKYIHPELYGQPESKAFNYDYLQKLKQSPDRPELPKP